MARALVIEEDSGTCRGWVHPHNGYYAGDFAASGATPVEPVWSAMSLRHLHLLPRSAASVTPPGDRPADHPSDRRAA